LFFLVGDKTSGGVKDRSRDCGFKGNDKKVSMAKPLVCSSV
jgi:hypothetical protein